MNREIRAPALFAALGLAYACVDAPPPLPQEGAEGSQGSSDASPPPGSSGRPGTGSMTAALDGSSTMTGSSGQSSGSECEPGEQGCTCVGSGRCNGDLVCVGDTCVVNLCGNDELDPGEDCDDGNSMDNDGCQIDCTISPGAAEVIAGDEHVCVRFHTGQIKCWGNFGSGRLGYPGQLQNIGEYETPADEDFVDVGEEVVELALGSDFTCARLVTDEVICWGNGANGRLGQGNTDDLGIDEAPSTITPISLGAVPIQIAAGDEHACAVLESGDLRCWGRNYRGQVGIPGEQNVGDNEVPTDLGPVNVGGNVLQVAAGSDHTCALMVGGTVRCWGGDNLGQLGTPAVSVDIGDDEDPMSSPEVVLSGEVVLISARYNHTCAAHVTGEIQCWGVGGSGRLGYGGIGNVGDDEDPTMVMSLAFGGNLPTSLAAGALHTCIRLDSTEVFCWGEGDNGRLGYGDEVDLLAPFMTQVNLALSVGPRQVTAGSNFSCATTTGSEVKCWGGNNMGQLGYGRAWDGDLGDNEVIGAIGAVMIE